MRANTFSYNLQIIYFIGEQFRSECCIAGSLQEDILFYILRCRTRANCVIVSCVCGPYPPCIDLLCGLFRDGDKKLVRDNQTLSVMVLFGCLSLPYMFAKPYHKWLPKVTVRSIWRSSLANCYAFSLNNSNMYGDPKNAARIIILYLNSA